MPYNAYATYTVFFADQAELDFALSFITDPDAGGIRICPVDAASLFGITWPPPGGAIGDKGFIFAEPYRPNINIPHPGPSGVILDPAISVFTVPGQVLPGFPLGDTMILYWCCQPVFRGPEYSGADPTLVAPIPPRRWAIGFEGAGIAECHPQGGTGNKARDASRVVNGIGLKLRTESTGSSTIECLLSSSEGANLPSRQSWERFYVRLRKLGNITGDLWRCTGTVSSSAGARLILNTDGTLTAFNVDAFGVNDATFGSSPALAVDTWYRIDVLVQFCTAGLNGTLRVYFNGVNVISGVQGTGSTGLGQIQNHRGSYLLAFGTSTWEIDLDDWHNAEIPNITGVEVLNSIDWLIGTHVRSSYISPGTAVNWAGIIPALNQFPNPAGSNLSLVSTTALATINLPSDLTDFGDADTQDATGVIIGPATVAVSINGSQAGGASNNGRLGYSVAGGGNVLTSTPLGGGATDATRTYLPSGSILPYPIFPFKVLYEKGNDANSSSVFSLTAYCQYVGLWGPEDGQMGEDPGLVFNRLLHNCRYPSLGWTIMGPVPDAPVCVVGGTYVGNGTFQSIALVLPCHILIIRNTTGGVPVVVNTTMMAPQNFSAGAAVAGDIPIIGADSTGQSFFQVVGNGARVNQNTITYEYFAFCDPGLRYLINGELNHGTSALNFNNPIIDTLYTPQFGMFFANPAGPGGIWFKGLGHSGQEVTTVAGTLVSNAVQFNTGNLFSGDGISEQGNATAYTLFRTIDGSNVTMVQTLSYVGNGAGSRVINLTPVSNRFPLVAFVTPRGGATIYRDPNHAGVNSITLSSGGNVANGITAGGVDTITVGSLLNVNLTIYDVLVIPGSGSGWLNGVFCGPNGLAPGDFWEDPPIEPPPNVGEIGEGGLTLGGVPPITLLQDVSGIYTLTPGKRNDTLYDRQAGQTSIDMEIPDPTFKTGYVGG